MARGWESKSVEQQQEERAASRGPMRAPLSAKEQERGRKRDGLLLSRERLTQQLKTAVNPRHRQILNESLAEINKQLASFDEDTSALKPK